jgi:sensor domain CHASE-containing protein
MSRGAERFDHTPNSYSDYPPHQASMYSGKGIDVKVTISPSRNTQFQKRAEEPSNFNNTSTYSHLRDKLNTMKQALH